MVNIVTAITGASGALYAQRFIQGLVQADVNVHLVVSPLGRRLLHDELGLETIERRSPRWPAKHHRHALQLQRCRIKIASGSFLHDGMVIVPCSSNTLARSRTARR
jgi:4-hydroxy-3-polyprenylbenzoate decarboxylase